ncbi:MAG: translation initiation factor IF-3 [bacterium]
MRGKKDESRMNESIRASEVRLIGEDGSQKGVVSIKEALEQAQSVDLDLVEISPDAKPPVCRIMDYSKFKYQQEKKQREARKSHKQVHMKEIKIRPKIGEHDLMFKVNHIREFLEHGDRVKVTMVFRGRERSHTELGANILANIQEEFRELATIEQKPKMMGSSMIMLMVPIKK